MPSDWDPREFDAWLARVPEPLDDEEDEDCMAPVQVFGSPSTGYFVRSWACDCNCPNCPVCDPRED